MREFELFSCFQDRMVLQREADIKIWGWAAPETALTLSFCGEQYNTRADSSGEFIFSMRTGSAGGPYEMTISSENDRVVISDVLLGDVYIISGQSNMQLQMERTIDLVGERMDKICYPKIREYRVPEKAVFGKTETQFYGGGWLVADTKEELMQMSATGFNFAENIHLSEGVPIGLINNSIGGTPIEAHLPEEVLAKYKVYDETIKQCKDASYVEAIQKKDIEDMDKWYKMLDDRDPGMQDGMPVYAEEEYDDSHWGEINIPGMFYGGPFEDWHGSIWFRKEFNVPDGYDLEGALLRLGTMVDGDTVYLNGVQVGSTDYCYPPRRYLLPQRVLRHGKNVLTIRLIINRGVGGFTEGKRYCIQGRNYIYEGSYMGQAANPSDANPSSGRWELDLSGAWKCIKGAQMEALPLMEFFIYKPTALYNGMMHPLLKYSFRGALWYQGESNMHNTESYALLMEDLIKCYRKWFGADLPFLFVGLPQFGNPELAAPLTDWAEIREKQRQVLKLPDVAMSVTIDIGESNDLHPQNKEAIGKRLALAAQNIIYNKKVAFSGPLISTAEYDAGHGMVILHFSGQDSKIVLVNDNYHYFEVCIDGKWTPASGFEVKDADNLIVYYNSENKKCPTHIRYAWANNPCNPPVYDNARLPAAPFVI